VPEKTEGSRVQDRDPSGEDGISTGYYPRSPDVALWRAIVAEL